MLCAAAKLPSVSGVLVVGNRLSVLPLTGERVGQVVMGLDELAVNRQRAPVVRDGRGGLAALRKSEAEIGVGFDEIRLDLERRRSGPRPRRPARG